MRLVITCLAHAWFDNCPELSGEDCTASLAVASLLLLQSLCVWEPRFTVTVLRSECNQHSKARWGPGSCCYHCGKQRSINYVCSRHCAHNDSGKLSVTFCDPVHIHREYGCAEKALVTSHSRKGHSYSWTKRCRISICFLLECLWSYVITTTNAHY